MSSIAIGFLVALNLGLLFVVLAVPLGRRMVTASVWIAAPVERIWQALWPLGGDAGWSGEVVGARALPEDPAKIRLVLGWEGRDGTPIERTIRLLEVEPGARFGLTVVDDNALDPVFWRDYRETVTLTESQGGTLVSLSRTDRYRGLAFLIFRFFALRRQALKLKIWGETGTYEAGGLFERPTTQIGLAVLSMLLIWPLFGLTAAGFVLSGCLTLVVGLHELGHLAAFRLMGHRRVRMIFIPLLGGVAIGSRPYNSQFEVAFVALMGAGFSAFLVPPVILASTLFGTAGEPGAAVALAMLAGCAALFNIANLVPVWKFDGGQVLRQVCPSPLWLGAASFSFLATFLAFAYGAGFSAGMLFSGAAIFAVLSFITAGTGVEPRFALKPISRVERIAVGAGLVSAFVIHGAGVLWAASRLIS